MKARLRSRFPTPTARDRSSRPDTVPTPQTRSHPGLRGYRPRYGRWPERLVVSVLGGPSCRKPCVPTVSGHLMRGSHTPANRQPPGTHPTSAGNPPPVLQPHGVAARRTASRQADSPPLYSALFYRAAAAVIGCLRLLLAFHTWRYPVPVPISSCPRTLAANGAWRCPWRTLPPCWPALRRLIPAVAHRHFTRSIPLRASQHLPPSLQSP